MTLEEILDKAQSEIIKIEDIAECFDLLREPFKVYGDTKVILEKHPKEYFSVPNRRFDGRPVGGRFSEKADGYIIFEPKEQEFEWIELWKKIYKTHKLLCDLRQAQIDSVNANSNFEDFQEVKKRLKNISIKIESLWPESFNYDNKIYSSRQAIAVQYSSIMNLSKEDRTKRIIKTCCDLKADILNGALTIGLKRNEFDLFIEAFEDHKLSKFGHKKYSIGPAEIDLPAMMEDIFQIANLFETSQIRDYFLDGIYIDAQTNDNPKWAITLGTFNKLFSERHNIHGNKIAHDKDNAPKTSNRKDVTLLELFMHNEERLSKFWELLKLPNDRALSENHQWIYNGRKSSIVACFSALEDLGLIKRNLPKATIRRCVATEIQFGGNEKLFRGSFNDEDYQHFHLLFERNLNLTLLLFHSSSNGLSQEKPQMPYFFRITMHKGFSIAY